MRILYAITRGEVGGAQEHCYVVATGAMAAGHDVGIVVERPSSLADRMEAAGATVLPWPDVVRAPNPVRDVRARRQLRTAVEHFQPDVLHLSSSKAGVLGRGILQPPDGVTVFTCHHAPYGPGRRWRHRVVARPVEQATLRHLDGIISDGARDMPLLRKLAPGVPIKLIRNAVPVAGPPTGAAPNHVALWVARLQDPKEPLLAVRAWARVVREIPDARLLMCGTGPLEKEVRAAVARCDATGSVEVLGQVPDLSPYREAASVFVLASANEGGITMATLEAMREGLVPVLSDVGDAFLLDHAECGVVVQPRSSAALANGIIELFGDPERIGRMRDRALRFAREEWTVADLAGSTLDFYVELLGR